MELLLLELLDLLSLLCPKCRYPVLPAGLGALRLPKSKNTSSPLSSSVELIMKAIRGCVKSVYYINIRLSRFINGSRGHYFHFQFTFHFLGVQKIKELQCNKERFQCSMCNCTFLPITMRSHTYVRIYPLYYNRVYLLFFTCSITTPLLFFLKSLRNKKKSTIQNCEHRTSFFLGILFDLLLENSL